MINEVCLYVSGSISCVKDCAERLFAKIIFEIEGCNIDFVNENEKLRSEFYSHLSEDSTTQSHIISMLNDMKKIFKLEKVNLMGKY